MTVILAPFTPERRNMLRSIEREPPACRQKSNAFCQENALTDKALSERFPHGNESEFFADIGLGDDNRALLFRLKCRHAIPVFGQGIGAEMGDPLQVQGIQSMLLLLM